ncbi:NAD(P)H-quinone oxidoreductase [Marinimicrobium alkaliphilum]|uniref:NAD(P)H-quinone oxidoreductase n=1 Tax=Marinimicrobium alkaliphilum TaxID=2202654 RepID=UPI000DB921DA|nr:NAD(P)H-quinone oxidoreductase [Marinimicrobium alkaliphilum]
MRYIDCRDRELHVATGARPEPGPGELLIAVAAAGVNRPDLLQRQGLYPPPADASPILGLEVAGEVVARGTGVSGWRVGDVVCALVNGGGYAEYALAPADQCLPVPKGLTLTQAAALPETCFTVWHNLWQRAHLSAGETLLIHGGASGIGTTAIQMATALGVTVFVTAGSDAKCRACEQLGAAMVINYHDEDFVAAVKAATDKRGVDVILDMVGGDVIQQNLYAAAREGRIVNIAYLNGSKVEIDLLPVMLKRLTLTGSTLRAQSAAVKARIARELREQVWPLIEKGAMAPVIAATFDLARADEAHALMASRQSVGKIVLTCH